VLQKTGSTILTLHSVTWYEKLQHGIRATDSRKQWLPPGEAQNQILDRKGQ